MSYILGYITADGCIVVSKDRKKHPLSLNITSAEKRHLYRIRKALNSHHKIGKKTGGSNSVGFQIQIRNPTLTNDLITLGILPRKTYNLEPIKVPDAHFADFVRGFFDGDGTVYLYKVNGVIQIKAKFVSTSLPFITNFSQRLCENIGILPKSIHYIVDKNGIKMPKYEFDLYIDDCEKLAKFMYTNNLNLCLPRKRRIFEKWISIERRHYIKQNYPSKVGWHLNKSACV